METMERTRIKTFAIIGMVISLVSFAYMIAALVTSFTVEGSEIGHPSIGYWRIGIIVALGSLLFYFTDAILSIIKILMGMHPIYNAVLALLLLGTIPMWFFVVNNPSLVLLWNAYYLAIFVLEVISIVKHIKLGASGCVY